MHFLDSNNFLTKILDLFNKNRIYIANTNTQADFQFIASNNYCRFTGFKINNAFAGNNGSSAIDINKDVINVLMPLTKSYGNLFYCPDQRILRFMAWTSLLILCYLLPNYQHI